MHDQEPTPPPITQPEPPPAYPREDFAGPAYPRFAPVADQSGAKRVPTAWIVLGLLFAFLIVTSLFSLRKSSIQPTADPYFEQEIEIKSVMKQKAFAAEFPSLNQGTAPKISQDTINRFRKDAATHPQAARLLVAAEHENGSPVTTDLKLIRALKAPQDREFEKIYQSQALTEPQAQSLTADFPKNDFSFVLARVHAFDKAGDPGPRKAASPPGPFALIALGSVLLLGGLGLGVVLWIAYAVLRTEGRLPLPQHPAEPLTKGEADRLAYRGVLLMITFLIIGVMVGSVKGLSEAGALFLEFSLMAVAVVLIHQMPVFGERIPLARIGVTVKGRNVFQLVGWGIVGYIMALPGLAIALAVGTQLMKVFGQSTHPAAELAADNPSLALILALYFSASIVAPFWEEIMFRGTLLPALSRLCGKPVWGILISSFLFASIHPQGIPLWLGLGYIGAMSAMLSYHTRSLIPSMVLHALNNALVISVILLLSS